MYKRVISILIMATVLSVLLAACGGGDEATATRVSPTPTLVPPAPTPTTPPTPDGKIIEVTLVDKGQDYQFNPADFTFKAGERVRLKLTSQSEFHTFTATDLPTQEGQEINVFVNGGETVEFEFTPSQAGTFDLICVPHQLQGMVGTITVNP